MSLVDAARRLAADCPMETDRGGRGECHYCAGGNYEGGYLGGSPTLPDVLHESDCPWLSLPRIAAALEAAERLSLMVNAYLAELETSDPPNVDDLADELASYQRATRGEF